MRIFAFTVLIFSAHIVCAQKESVPVKEKFRLFKNRVSRQLEKADSVKLLSYTDSVHFPQPDSIREKSLFTRLRDKADSVKSKIQGPDTIRNADFSGSQLTDSIRNTFKLPDRVGGISPDSLKNELTLPGGTIRLPADSIKNRAERATTKVNEKIAETQERLKVKSDSLEIPGELREWQNKIGDKAHLNLPGQAGLPMSEFSPPSAIQKPDVPMPGLPALKTPETGSSNDIPRIPDIKLPDQKDHITDTRLPDLKNNLPAAELPEIDAAEKINENFDVAADLPHISKPDSSQLKEWKDKALEDERFKKYSEQVNQVSDKLDPYKKNLDSLTFRDAGEIAAHEIETNAGNIDGLKELDANAKTAQAAMALPQQAALLQRYQDKRIMKEEMLRKSKNVMNDKINTFTPEMKARQKDLAKVKKLNASVPSVKNMKHKRTDPLKERPLYERIVPGIALQTHGGNVFAIDFAPQVSYRITSYLSAGTGILYRVGFDKEYSSFISGQGVYGFRTFMDYRLVKGLFVHGEYERITVTDRFEYSDKLITSGFHSGYIGLGKRYPISRKFNGSLLALYKFEMGDHLVGTTKFNLRVIIEYKTKKIRKPTDIN